MREPSAGSARRWPEPCSSLATTGLRRAELCALRRGRDLDLERRLLRVSASVVKMPGAPLREIPTKNRRTSTLARDDLTVILDRLGLRWRRIRHLETVSL